MAYCYGVEFAEEQHQKNRLQDLDDLMQECLLVYPNFTSSKRR